MGPKTRTWLIGILAVGLAGYVGLCGYLFAEQRHILYRSHAARLAGQAAGSGYQPLDIREPGLGAIRDWWAPPSSRATPTVVFFHGNGCNVDEFATQAGFYRQRGWGVVLASYRGYSGNPGRPTEAGLMADARAALAAVSSRVGPVIVWGHSLGSGVAAQMASEGRASGLVLEAPYTSVTDLAARRYSYVPVRLLLLDRFDTRALVGRIKVPVLIFHSTDDPTIPFAMGQELAERLGARATLVRLNGVGHQPHELDLSDVVVQWAYARHIGG